MDWRFIYRGLKARYRDERQEILALLGGLSPDRVAVDVGANKGSYLWSLGRAVPNGKVVAFEPQPVLADYLKRVCAANHIQNVVVEAAGVSSRPGTMTLHIPGGGSSSPGASLEEPGDVKQGLRRIEIPVVTLDEYFSGETRKIGALKIDVEGHELSVLQGAANIIARHKPVIVCECEQRHLRNSSVTTVLEFVCSFGYRGFFSTGKRILPISEFDPGLHQKQIGENFWNARDYYNNFIFLP